LTLCHAKVEGENISVPTGECWIQTVGKIKELNLMTEHRLCVSQKLRGKKALVTP